MEKKLNKLISSFEKRTPTINMMLWMVHYDQICDRICCHSSDCGSIRCSGCYSYLTGIPPSVRYQCIECEILPPETNNNPRPEICEKCFESKFVTHNHASWLKIDSKGYHSLVERKFGISELKQLIIQDFPIVQEILPSDEYCQICYDNFYDYDKNPPVSYPGCAFYHGNPIDDKLKGLIDSKKYNHSECLMNWYKMTNRNKYSGNLSYCKICIFLKEKSEWENIFLSVKTKISSENSILEILNYIEKHISIVIDQKEMEAILKGSDNKKELNRIVFNKLIHLHPQEWLKEIIKNIFKYE